MRLSLGLSLTSASVLGGTTPDTTAPVVTSSTYDNGTTTVSLDIVEATGTATCYWALVANPSTPTEAQVVAGTGGGILESGSFTVTTGGDTDLINVTDVTGNEIHIVIKDAAGNSTGTPSAANNTVITGVTVTGSGYTVNAVDNQTTGYIANTTTYVGPAAGKTGTVSLWFNAQGTWNSPSAARLFRLAKSGVITLELYTSTSGRMQIVGKNESSTTVMSLLSASSTFVVGSWYHILISWDLANNLKSWYVNDTLNAFTTTTFDNDNLASIETARVWGQGTTEWDGYMAQVWVDTTYRDFSVEATRRNFITAGGKPADLTGYGSPHLWLQGDAASVGTNSGTGGNLTVAAGAFVDAPSSPSD